MAGQGYTQFANGTLNEVIAGLNNFGVINVTGAANLAGTLDIMLQGGYDPSNGSQFKFLNFTPGMLTGSFTTVDGTTFNSGTQMFVLNYNPALGFVELTAEPTSSNATYWLGGTGNWSTNAMWSMGTPTASQDATIYSGLANDLVTLDSGTEFAKSLTLGGVPNGFTSELTDGGTAQNLTITNFLSVGQQGTLLLTGGSTVTAGADSTNAGLIDLENASTLTINGNLANSGTIQTGASAGGGNNLTVSGNFSNSGSFSLNANLDLANVGSITNTGSVYLGYGTQLNLSNQPGGVTDVGAGSSWQIYGSFTENSTNFGFENLSSIEGTIDLENQQSSTINPGGSGGTLTIASTGAFDIGNGTSLTITGNVDNSGELHTGRFNVGGNTLTITGNLINEAPGSFTLWNGIPPDGTGDVANIGGTFTNAGATDVEGGSTLNVTGDVTNTGSIYTDFHGNGGGNSINIGGTLNNSGTFQLLGPTDTATIGSLTNNGGGFVDVEGGSTLSITGDVTNSGAGANGIYTSFNGTGGNTIDIGGTLTNTGRVGIESTGDMLTVTGAVTNNSGGLIAFTGGSNGTFESGLTNNAGAQVDLENASKLTIDGDVNNGGTLSLSGFGGTGGNTLNISGMLTNGGTFLLNGPGDMATIGNGMVNTGTVTMRSGETLQINGNVTNAGTIETNINGGNNTISISGTLTNNGEFELLHAGDVASIGSVVNSGTVDLYSAPGNVMFTVAGNFANSGLFFIENGVVASVGTLNNTGTVGVLPTSTLNLTSQPNGITDIVAGSTFNIGGTFTAGPSNAFYLLTSVEGNLYLYNQQTTSVTPTGGLLTIAAGGSVTADSPYGGQTVLQINGDLANAGTVDLERGSSVQIVGNFDNTGTLITNTYGLGGHNTITLIGMLTNGGTFQLNGPADMATVGNGLTNNAGGTIDLENGSTLSITGDASNSGFLFTSFHGGSGGNTLTITGTLTNQGSGGQFALFGPGDMAIIGSLVNSNLVDAENGSTLEIEGNVNNSGTLETDFNGLGGGNTLTIAGNLTNDGDFVLHGFGDKATIGGNLTNTDNIYLWGSGSMATIDGGLTNSAFADVENGSTLKVNGAVTNSGILATDYYGFGGGNTITIGGMLTNSGTFQLNGLGDMANIGNGMTNSGTVDLENGSTLTIDGAVTNSGTIETSAGNNTITLNGLLTNTPTGIITLNGSMDMLQALAGIVNSGTINVNNSSTIDPPFFNNLGTLNIDSTSTFIVGTGHASGPGYIQLANGTLGEMISSSAFGVINVNGSALLNGTLDVLLQGGYDPSVGSSYKFLLSNANGINGVFSNIENDIFNGGTEKWGVIYDSADGYVELLAESNGTPVPEPGTLLVLIPALFGAGFVLRRQLFR